MRANNENNLLWNRNIYCISVIILNLLINYAAVFVISADDQCLPFLPVTLQSSSACSGDNISAAMLGRHHLRGDFTW